MGSVQSQGITEQGFDGVGCYFVPSGSQDPIFFSDDEGAVMNIAGEHRTMGVADRASQIADFSTATAYVDVAEEYLVSFSDVGAPQEVAPETRALIATLSVNEFGTLPHFLVTEGELTCGV